MASSFSRTWIPNQHGAWAFLIAPVVVGALAGGPGPWQLLLLGAWLMAYCLNYYVGLSVKSRKPQRYAQQLRVYGAATVLLGIPLLLAHTTLLYLGAVALPVFLANLLFISRRNERAWANDMLGVLLAGVVGFGAFIVATDDGAVSDAQTRHAVLALISICLYFAGTVLYVKTLIRERGSATWLRISYGYHAALVGIAIAVHAWVLAAIALALLARARIVPTKSWTPKRVGLMEIIPTVAVGVAALLTLP